MSRRWVLVLGTLASVVVMVVLAAANLLGLMAQMVALFLGMLGLLVYAGFGVTWLLGPRRLGPVLPLFMPVVGFAVISMIGHALGYLPIGTNRTAWPILGILTLVNCFAWFRGARLAIRQSHLGVIAIGVVAVAVSWIPFYRLGYVTTIGGTIDALSYMTRAEYIQNHGLMIQPSYLIGRPALGVIHEAVRTGMRQGDAYLLAFACSLFGIRPHFLFPLLMSLWYGLTSVGTWVLARVGFGMRRSIALFAALFVVAQPLVHWALLDNFLSQAGGTALWPFVLVAVVLALRDGGWRAVVLGGLLIATLATVYHAYLLFLLPVAALSASYDVVMSWFPLRGSAKNSMRATLRKCWQLTLRGCGIVVVALTTIPFAWVLLARQFLFLSNLIDRNHIEPGARGNILVFFHPGELFGLVNHLASMPTVAQLPTVLLTIGCVLCCGVVVIALIASSGRHRWIMTMVLVVFLPVVWQQRFWLDQGRGYAYGYFKVVALLCPPLCALLIQGTALLIRFSRSLHGPCARQVRCAALAIPAFCFVTGFVHILRADDVTIKHDVVADQGMLAAEQAIKQIPTNQPILEIEHESPIAQPWLAYLMGDRPVYFSESTALWGGSTRSEALQLISYAIISHPKKELLEVVPEPWFDPAKIEVVWKHDEFVLVRRKDDVVADVPLALPGTREITLDTPFFVKVQSARVYVRSQAWTEPLIQRYAALPTTVLLTVSAPSPTTITVTTPHGPDMIRLAAGQQTVSFPITDQLQLRVVDTAGQHVKVVSVQFVRRT